jgi:hypothetical protein
MRPIQLLDTRASSTEPASGRCAVEPELGEAIVLRIRDPHRLRAAEGADRRVARPIEPGAAFAPPPGPPRQVEPEWPHRGEPLDALIHHVSHEHVCLVHGQPVRFIEESLVWGIATERAEMSPTLPEDLDLVRPEVCSVYPRWITRTESDSPKHLEPATATARSSVRREERAG